MAAYRIETKDGFGCGVWLGANEAEALAAMHRSAGYAVLVVDGRLVFSDRVSGWLCGGLDAWVVTPLARNRAPPGWLADPDHPGWEYLRDSPDLLRCEACHHTASPRLLALPGAAPHEPGCARVPRSPG